MRRLVWLVAALGLLLARPASANGRFPASNAVVFDPHDAKTIYVRVTFGLLVTHDAGQTWRWVCERAIGFSGIEDPTYVVTPKGTLVGGTFSGISVSRDGGCSWSFSGGAGTHLVSDLAMRPEGSIVGITSTYKKAGPEGSLYENKVLVSKDDATTFTVSGGAIDPTLLLESIEIADSDPQRLYISAVRGEGDKRTFAFLASYNEGLSWVERKLDIQAGETGPFIAIVDPKNADRVYVRTAGTPEAKTRLLVTDDAGKTWRKVLDSATPLLGFAIAADGSKVWVGNKEGVSYAPTDTFTFTKGFAVESQCLGAAGATLWSCSSERGGYFVGSSKNGGRSFEARVHLEEIKGPLECPAESNVTKICVDDWVKQRRELGLPDPTEKGGRVDTGAPQLRGRAEKPSQTRSSIVGVIMLIAILYLGYELLRWIRKKQRGG
ncbi:MAG: hypothetical protein KIT84_08655 [Labilithrix sp.]|nr:hypothetical protein [Labilithrix sp.]MCW5811069.1 hypothetical protein [Labilithrix sp.]